MLRLSKVLVLYGVVNESRRHESRYKTSKINNKIYIKITSKITFTLISKKDSKIKIQRITILRFYVITCN